MHAVTVKNSALNLRPITSKAGLITVTASAVTYADMTGLAGSGAITVDDTCTHVGLTFEGTSAREAADGSTPTASVGLIRPDGATDICHVSDFKARKWIRTGGSNTKIWVQQYNNG